MYLVARLELFLCIILCSVFSSCSSCLQDFTKARIEKNFMGYVPGRILVLDTLDIRQNQIQDKTITKPILKRLTESLDKKVLNIFKDQPYLEIISLSSQKENKDTLLFVKKIKDLLIAYAANKNDFQTRNEFFVFYNETLKEDNQWLLSIYKLSVSYKYCDALLLPFIFQVKENHTEEKNIISSNRMIQYGVALIDVESSNIIWLHLDRLKKSHKQLKTNVESIVSKFPDWKIFVDNMYKKNFWINFPGMLF